MTTYNFSDIVLIGFPDNRAGEFILSSEEKRAYEYFLKMQEAGDRDCGEEMPEC